MNRPVIISIKPQWCDAIASGEKTVEVRKNRPVQATPFRCYIYETQGRTETPWVDEDGHTIFRGRGEIVGEFVCDRIQYFRPGTYNQMQEHSMIPWASLVAYDTLGNGLYGWHISDLEIYERPRSLADFGLARAPQSWCYAKEVEH